MPISESMVQDIVQEVMAKMQIADAPAGKHGDFQRYERSDRGCESCPEDRS